MAVLLALIFLTELVRTVLTFLTELVLTVQSPVLPLLRSAPLTSPLLPLLPPPLLLYRRPTPINTTSINITPSSLLPAPPPQPASHSQVSKRGALHSKHRVRSPPPLSLSLPDAKKGKKGREEERKHGKKGATRDLRVGWAGQFWGKGRKKEGKIEVLVEFSGGGEVSRE